MGAVLPGTLRAQNAQILTSRPLFARSETTFMRLCSRPTVGPTSWRRMYGKLGTLLLNASQLSRGLYYSCLFVWSCNCDGRLLCPCHRWNEVRRAKLSLDMSRRCQGQRSTCAIVNQAEARSGNSAISAHTRGLAWCEVSACTVADAGRGNGMHTFTGGYRKRQSPSCTSRGEPLLLPPSVPAHASSVSRCLTKQRAPDTSSSLMPFLVGNPALSANVATSQALLSSASRGLYALAGGFKMYQPNYAVCAEKTCAFQPENSTR